MFTIRLTSLSLLLGLLAACSKTESPPAAVETPAPAATTASAPAELPRPCAFLSAEQASSILGNEAGLMVDEPENCSYTASAGVGQIAFLMLAVQRHESEAMAIEVYNSLTGLNPQLAKLTNDMAGEKTKKSGEQIDGLGDEAALAGGNFDLVGSRTLTVRKGAVVIHYNLTGMRSPAKPKDGLAQREALITAARGLVAQL